MRYWQACSDFLRELKRDFRHTGAVVPSSRFLAKELAAPLRSPRPPARILEVGAGTGAITAEIAKYLQPGDQLDAVEISARFIAFLRRRLNTEKRFLGCRRQIHLLHSPIESLEGEAKYDFIVSCLPFNNFPPEQVRRIFEVYRRLLVPGGTLTFYEYALIRQLKRPFAGPRERKRLYRVGRIVASYVKDYQFKRKQVLVNIPPATVRHLHLEPRKRGSRALVASP